jgi:hypothetical protein
LSRSHFENIDEKPKSTTSYEALNFSRIQKYLEKCRQRQ